MTIAQPAVAALAVIAFIACSKSQPSTTATPSSGTGAMAAAPPAAPAKPYTVAMVAEGDSIFHQRSCRNCHGPDAKGAKNGPNLTSGPYLHMSGQYDEIVRIITTGIPLDSIKDKAHPNAMRGRGGNPPLTDDQIKAVAAYVYSLEHP